MRAIRFFFFFFFNIRGFLGYLLNSTIYKIGWSPYKANNQQQRTPSVILVLHPIVNNDEVYACNLCIEGLDSEEDVKKHPKDKHDKVVEKDEEVSSSDMKLDIERLSFENEEHNKEEEETMSIKENVTMTKCMQMPGDHARLCLQPFNQLLSSSSHNLEMFQDDQCPLCNI